MTRTRQWIMGVTFAVVASVAGAFYTVLDSEAGLQWLLARVMAQVPGALTIATVRGELGGPIELQDIAYQHDGLEVRVGHVTLDWNLWGIFAGVLRIDRLLVSDVDVVLPPSDPNAAPPTLPEITMPFRLSVRDLAVNTIQVRTNHAAEPVMVQSISLAGHMFASTVSLDHLDVIAPAGTLDVSGELKTAAQYPMDFEVRWSGLVDRHAIGGRGAVSGDLARLEIDQHLERPLILDAKIALVNALIAPHWEAAVDAHEVLPKELLPQWPLNAVDVSVVAHGNTVSAQGTVTLRGAHSSTGKFELVGELAYDERRLKVAALTGQLVGRDTRVQARGEIAFDPNAAQSIAGAQFTGEWRHLRWPLAGEPVAVSRDGEFRFSGTPDNYSYELTAPVAGNNLPSGDWVVHGDGDARQTTVRDVTIATLGGSVRAKGQVQWSPQVRWRVDVDARDIDPSKQWPSWPGNLAARLSYEGAVADQRVQGRIDVSKLDGRLRDYPVSLQLKGTMDGDNIRAESVQLRSGDATLAVRGGVAEVWDLDAALRAPKLAALYPGALGTVIAEVRVRGARAQPRANATFTAERVKVGDVTVDHVDADAALDWNLAAPSRVTLRANRLLLSGWRADELRINSDGSLARHRMLAELTAPDGGGLLEVKGALQDGRWSGDFARAAIDQPRIGAWELRQPAHATADSRHAELARACWRGHDGSVCVAAAWTADEFVSADVALDRIPATLLKGYFPERVAIAGLASGTLRARYALAGDGALDAALGLNVDGGELAVADVSEDSVRIAFRNAELTAQADAQGLRSSARLDFGALGRADAKLDLPRWKPKSDTATQPVAGKVHVEVNDLGLISRLTPALDDARGVLRADVEIGGTATNPQLKGNARLSDGAVAIPQIGIKLTGITMEASNTPGNLIQFVARGKSGPGFVELRGEFVPEKERGWPVVVEITGQSFEVVNLPEARVLASPDLQLQVVRNRIDLNGVLNIPEASYSVRDTSSAVTPSSDVVLVGAKQAPAREEKWQIYSVVRFVFGDKVTFTGFGLKGKVRGDVVALEEPKKLTTGYGELQIDDATFNAYKIDLKVTRGRLTFAGGPINNPGIDARAVREAGTIRETAAKDAKKDLREPGGVVVGALVRGTVRKFELTLFSDPPRDQADVLSLLLFGVPLGEATTEEGKALFIAASTLRLTGRDDTVRKIGRRFGIEEIRLETGSTPEQASLVLGRYLGPRLYVNYSVGLLSASANVLRVRYRLSDKWTLQSEQSDAESAADLLYTFEH